MDKVSYISTSKAAELLQMTNRRIVGLCHEGKLEGAFQDGRNWMIPESSVLLLADKLNITEIIQSEKEPHLPFAIGNTSYKEVVSECYYVDKTLLIRDLIDDHNSVTLFTRPRRFGKTLTIDMIKTYFEKTDKDTSVYFQDKKIWQCGKKYKKLQGAYPVIMLTFKDVKYDSWKESFEAIRFVIKDEYKRHRYILTGQNLSPDDRDYFDRMEKGILTEVEYNRALLNLVQILSAHYQSKVVILIDEYDTPIQQGYSRGFYRNVISFMRNFLSGGLKDNHNLAFGVLTGIMRISKENLFSGLNNLTVNTVLNEKYSEYFGFTREEVSDMAAYYEVPEKMDEIRSWYDGYNFGGTSIYNPWSVTNYFADNCKPKAFWANTSDNEIIREILRNLTPEVSDDLSRALQGEDILTSLDMEVVYPKISEGANTIFSFLLLAGYLTPVSVPEETEFGTFLTLRLPNTEIRRVYNSEILSWIRGTSYGNVIAEVEKAIYLKDGKRLKEAIEKYMLNCISSFDGSAEGFYHGMVLGLVAVLSTGYYIRSNRESGEGRFDLQLEPKSRTDPGIIMEFKTVKPSEYDKLHVMAEEALKQICEKRYDTDMRERGIIDIAKYGIAFSGKSVEIVSQ